MWRNPKLRTEDGEQPEAPDAGPPKEQGERLATFPRSNRGGAEEELRVSLDSYQGHPFVSIRLWVQDRMSGNWWPTKKGCSIRMGEAEGVCDTLAQAVRLADARRGP